MNNPFEFMQSMMNQDNLANNFKAFDFNGLGIKNIDHMDFSSVSEMMKKNGEALVSANQMAAESFQSIAKRGSDSFQKNANEMLSSVKDAVSAGDMEQLGKSSKKYMQSTIENNISNTKEMLDVASKSTMEILDVVGKNLTDNIKQSNKKNKK